jgi:tRNA threonylcarbamoyladenosine modification (KEOPS) complex Cgi121 subunit
LLNVQKEILLAYSGREQIEQYLKVIYKSGRDGTTGAMTYNCYYKSMNSWVGMKKK